MQGLGFLVCVYIRVCVCVWGERDWFWTARPFYHFLFKKNLKKLIFKGHLLLSKANCCFSISCHLLLALPSEKRRACLVREGSRLGGGGCRDEAGNWKCSPAPSADDLVSIPEALWVGWRAAGHQLPSASGPSPSPSPLESLKWACFFQKGIFQNLLLLVFQSISCQKGTAMAGLVNLSSKLFYHQENNLSNLKEPQMESETRRLLGRKAWWEEEDAKLRVERPLGPGGAAQVVVLALPASSVGCSTVRHSSDKFEKQQSKVSVFL